MTAVSSSGAQADPSWCGWLARGTRDLPDGTDWLGSWEAARVQRMRYAKRRSEFMISRLAAKAAVRAALHPVSPAHDAIEVRHQPSGAPLLHIDGEPASMSISLTDRADWAVCLLGPAGAAIGCDLELVEPRSDAFLSDWFTPAEQRIVRAAPDAAAWALRANLIWSAKESALKVLKTGLRRDTRSVAVTGVDGNPDGAESVDGWSPLEVQVSGGALFAGWWIRSGDFLLTVAADQALPPPTSLEPAPLAEATPTHGWMAQPLVDPN